MYCSCYCSSRDCLQVVDTTERDRALAELDREREARRSAELEAAKVRMSQQLVLNECSQLRQELDRQRQQLELMRSVGFVRFLRVTPGLRELQPSRFFNWPASHHRTPQAGSSQRSFENISFSLRQDFLRVDVKQHLWQNDWHDLQLSLFPEITVHIHVSGNPDDSVLANFIGETPQPHC